MADPMRTRRRTLVIVTAVLWSLVLLDLGPALAQSDADR